MKYVISAAALCVVLGGSTTAEADHHDSEFGIGLATTFFVSGIDARLDLTDDLGLEAVVGFDFVSPDDEAAGAVTSFALGLRGLYGLWDFGSRARVFGFGGLSLQTLTDNDTLIGLEGGLKLEYFPVAYASISVDMGAAIGINDNTLGAGGSTTSINLGFGDLLGGASFNFWW